MAKAVITQSPIFTLGGGNPLKFLFVALSLHDSFHHWLKGISAGNSDPFDGQNASVSYRVSLSWIHRKLLQVLVGIGQLPVSMDWLKGKATGNQSKFPLNQSIEILNRIFPQGHGVMVEPRTSL